MEKELFDLVHSLYHTGKDLTDKYHILNTEEEWNQDDFSYLKNVFRIYHSDGYCFDVSNIYDEDLKERDYYIYSDWDGFKKVKDAEHAICLIS